MLGWIGILASIWYSGFPGEPLVIQNIEEVQETNRSLYYPTALIVSPNFLFIYNY